MPAVSLLAAVSGAMLVGVACIALFAVLAALEARLLFRLLRHGIRTTGIIIGEETGGSLGMVGSSQAHYPVVEFVDKNGSVRRFRSRLPRVSRDFIHPKARRVIYLPDKPEVAELFCGIHAYKHLAGMLVMLAFSVACTLFLLPGYFVD
ncbi:MAG: hypothetical protein JNL39_22620 [Opitutaceae bacterium]|nr:hypothetical protein [Opitutaceae bacterium]